MTTDTLDVAILGAGLAGCLLARQLRRQAPGLRIAQFERAQGTSFKVGEATVELFINHMLRRLGLSTYLYEQHLPKNGLRFFFDDETHSTPLGEMTEMGTQALPFHPSFQLDRQRLEADLRRMNVAAGVDLRYGTVRDLSLSADGASPHTFRVESDAGTTACTARWVIDATGRTSLIAKQRGLRVPTRDHNVASAWARYRKVVDIDDLDLPGFRARVRHTSRRLSTIHFTYPGYWIWFIPLGDDVISVGVVIDKINPRYDPGLLREAGFRGFLDQHRAIRDLLAPAELLDFVAYGHLAYGTTRVLDCAQRWATTGEAAAFTDPFYSPGSDFIALANDYITDLLVREGGGEDPTTLVERGELYDQYLRYRYDANLLLYRDQYDGLGSFPLLQLKWELDILCYYDLWVHSYMQDHHLDLDRVRSDLREKTFVLEALANFGKLFALTSRHLREQGTYFARNRGQYVEPLENLGCVKHVGLPMSMAEMKTRVLRVFQSVRDGTFVLLGVTPTHATPSFADYVTGRAFAPALAAQPTAV